MRVPTDLESIERTERLDKPREFDEVLKIYQLNKVRLDRLCERVSVKGNKSSIVYWGGWMGWWVDWWASEIVVFLLNGFLFLIFSNFLTFYHISFFFTDWIISMMSIDFSVDKIVIKWSKIINHTFYNKSSRQKELYTKSYMHLRMYNEWTNNDPPSQNQ